MEDSAGTGVRCVETWIWPLTGWGDVPIVPKHKTGSGDWRWEGNANPGHEARKRGLPQSAVVLP